MLIHCSLKRFSHVGNRFNDAWTTYFLKGPFFCFLMMNSLFSTLYVPMYSLLPPKVWMGIYGSPTRCCSPTIPLCINCTSHVCPPNWIAASGCCQQ
ncbi:hypothetical protein GDO78_001024 [Eleutherodactylus coqui]|uniref:Uncharacterized protein n=1 Tax=Eleutherodactylus coqui TaxID=57060 RepID=A0A8J6FRU7_ELECQ|nr:hypothetical protein GDO78_001024 [Eleutherodactylus coqui]